MDGSEDRSPASLAQIAAVGLAVFLGVVVTAVAVAKANVTAPSMGDIVVIKPGTDVPKLLLVELTERRIDGRDSGKSTTCVLQPEAMAAGGGSLVVEAREPGETPTYLVHWAGGSTARGRQDCGTSADLEMSVTDLERLAQIAGGFGVDQTRPAGTVDVSSVQVAVN